MRSLRSLVQIGFIFFCALNGTVDFYKDVGQGRLRCSRFLAIYRIVHNFVVFILTIKFLLQFLEVFTDKSESIVLRINFFTYFALVFLNLTSCMRCSYRWRNRIFVVMQKLQKLRELSRKMGYRWSKENRRYLNRLLVIITFLLILRLSIHLALFALSTRMGFNHSCNCFLPEFMIFAMNYLIFAILSEICQCWWRLESGLKMVLLVARPRSVTHQLHQVQRLHTMFQCLIDLTSEVGSIFEFVLLSYLLRNLWSGIVAGYMVVRVILGHGHADTEFMYILLALVTCIQPLMLSPLMNCLTNTTEFLLETTMEVLRTPRKQSAEVERSVEWLSLQFARQHTYIAIFGTFRMNRSLVFQSTSVILVHVLYMVQSDYISITK
ncbi:hypothetical protein M5D96_000425 [Drosophila gunungcola]|uniref:Gustatory receptor n=2 Tax=Drosophila gunungcola TaxID=103775 RepID=A0A9P9YW67_9MUSC|nr:hypothetical protein M5D96_000425 [Drosophila gunungcola]